MGGGDNFSLCVSLHPVGGVPPSFLMGRVPLSFMTGGYPHQDWMGIPPVGTGSGYSPPPIGTAGWGYLPSRTGWGTSSPIETGLGYPTPYRETEQQSEHLLCGRQYASCIHAGGLSFFFIFGGTTGTLF